MGYTQAMEMADMMDLEQGIRWHLRYNHFPPVPSEMIPVAVKAVKLCNRGKYETKIRTPYEHRVYGWKVPANVVVDCYHLEPWVDL